MKWSGGCLYVVIGLLLLGVLLVVGSNVLNGIRMDQANVTVSAVAREFGYRPDDFLYQELAGANISIISGSSECVNQLYFTTTMDASQFKQRLNELVSPVSPDEWHRWTGTMSFPTIEIPKLTVNGVTYREAWNSEGNADELSVTTYRRSDTRETLGASVTLFETSGAAGRLAYDGRPVQGNILSVYASAGRVPILVSCRIAFSDTPLLPDESIAERVRDRLAWSVIIGAVVLATASAWVSMRARRRRTRMSRRRRNRMSRR